MLKYFTENLEIYSDEENYSEKCSDEKSYIDKQRHSEEAVSREQFLEIYMKNRLIVLRLKRVLFLRISVRLQRLNMRKCIKVHIQNPV